MADSGSSITTVGFSPYTLFLDGSYIYFFNFDNTDTRKYEISTGLLTSNTTHSLNTAPALLNGFHDTANNLFYYTNGATQLLQDNLYVYDISAGTSTLVYYLQSASPVPADNQYLIEIDQSATSNLYLRVRDNHTKTVVLDTAGLGLDVTSTRGETVNIPFPTVAVEEFYSFQYAQFLTEPTAFDVQAAGSKVITDNLTLLAKTVNNNPFDGTKLLLKEGIYKIQVNTSIAPQVSSNALGLQVQDAVTLTELSATMMDTNKIKTRRYSAMFDPIVVDATIASNGILVTFDSVSSGGTFLNIFDMRIHITKIGDNI